MTSKPIRSRPRASYDHGIAPRRSSRDRAVLSSSRTRSASSSHLRKNNDSLALKKISSTPSDSSHDAKKKKRSKFSLSKPKSKNSESNQRKSAPEPFLTAKKRKNNGEPTFQMVWKRPELMVKFRLYLQRKHCAENLKFLIEVHYFQCIRQTKEKGEKAKEIFNKFFKLSGSHLLNIDADIRNRVEECINTKKYHKLFSGAYVHIESMLVHGQWPDFLLSDLYKEARRKPIKPHKIQHKKSDTLIVYKKLFLMDEHAV